MRVGWLSDGSNADGTVGGAELTQQEFAAAAPAGVEVVELPPGGVLEGLDRYVIHNVTSYSLDDIWRVAGAPRFKYCHDVMPPHGDLAVRDFVLSDCELIFCSPLQRDRMGLRGALIPPQVDLDRFRSAAAKNGQERLGAVSLGPWMNHGKAPHRAREEAPDVQFYGGGPCAPQGSVQIVYDDVPKILAKYRTFVHLPTALEPFGRTVVEAWAAGCSIVTNRLVGARWWIEEKPEKLETAAEDFWSCVLA